MQSVYVSLLSFMLIFLVSSCSASDNRNNNVQKALSPDDRISSEEIISLIKKGNDIVFSELTIIGVLDFTLCDEPVQESPNRFRINVDQSLIFNKCIFENNVLAAKNGENGEQYATRFNQNVTFRNCEFLKDVAFKESVINGLCDFSGSGFYGKVNFQGTFFNYPTTNFSKTTYKGSVQFQRTFFLGNVSFLNAIFDENVSFQSADIRGMAQFGAIKCNAYTDFGSIRCDGGWFMNYAVFSDRLVFNNARLYDRIEFIESQYLGSAKIMNTQFNGRLSLDNIKLSGTLDVSNSTFLMGKPDFSSIKIEDNAELIAKDLKIIDIKIYNE